MPLRRAAVMRRAMTDLTQLAAAYSVILCDIWGVIHDGGQLLPGAAQRLTQWKAEGKTSKIKEFRIYLTDNLFINKKQL